MKLRKFSDTKWLVSEIGIGCWAIGADWGNVNDEDARKTLITGFDNGVNFFDTAECYANSETLVGKVVKDRRQEYILATKCGHLIEPYGGDEYANWNKDGIQTSIERSLLRLQTDYVDLFQVHVPPKTEKEFADVEKAFDDIKSEGKARHCGISVGIRYEQGKEIIKRKLADSIQIYFSLIDQKPLKELLPLAKKNNIGVIIAEPLAQGLLTNKYKIGHTFPKNDLRSNGYSKQLLEKKLKRVKQFNFLIKKSPDPRVIFNRMEELMKNYSDRALLSIRKISDCEAKNNLENLVMFTRTTV